MKPRASRSFSSPKSARPAKENSLKDSVLPYRVQDNKIDGVVLALQDIGAVKSASGQLR